MNSAPEKVDSRVASLVGRVLVSAVVLVGLGGILVGLFSAHAIFLASREQRSSPTPIYIGQPSPSRPAQDRVQSPWPKFPRNSGSNAHRSLINGVEVLSEDWEGAHSPREVLAYYREQMSARGWQDVTEQLYSLRRDLPSHQVPGSPSLDQQYLSLHDHVTDSALALRRGGWLMHVTTEPSPRGRGRIVVRILAASTPSLPDFWSTLIAPIEGKTTSGKHRRPFEYVETRGGLRYRTEMSTKQRAPARAFEEALAGLQAKKWRPLNLSSRAQNSTLFAWLVKDNMHAGLWVTPLPGGKGACVTVTEVTSK